MVRLNFGTLNFNNEEEYFFALGTFCNRKAFSIFYEPNKSTGSYADAYRTRKLSTVQNLIKPIENAIRSNNRINCNSYVEELLDKHNFIQNGKVIYGTIENVIKTVPESFIYKFIEGYTKSAESDNNSIIVYDADNIRSTATSLKKTTIPKHSRSIISAETVISNHKTKYDYIKEHIRNTYIGERGERLVYELERKKLKNAVNEGKIPSMDKLLKWVSLEDDSLGYDILSYDAEIKRPIFIEVKTTTKTKFTPFYMSTDEIEFSKKNATQYKLYRVFNLNNATAEYFELVGDISDSTNVKIDAVNYLVTLK